MIKSFFYFNCKYTAGQILLVWCSKLFPIWLLLNNLLNIIPLTDSVQEKHLNVFAVASSKCS